MKYILVKWPMSRKLEEQEWFNECYLMCDPVHLVQCGPQAFFVPEERYQSLYGNQTES